MCAVVLLVLVCGVGVSAQAPSQFPKGSMASGDFSDNNVGPAAAKSAPQVAPVELGEPSEAGEANLWANWPYVALFILCACVVERVRERRIENRWKRQHPAEGQIMPLVQLPIEAMAPAFRPLTAVDMIAFSRPSAAARAADPSLHVVVAGSESWQAEADTPSVSGRASSRA